MEECYRREDDEEDIKVQAPSIFPKTEEAPLYLPRRGESLVTIKKKNERKENIQEGEEIHSEGEEFWRKG